MHRARLAAVRLLVAAACPAAAFAQYGERVEVHAIEIPAVVRDAHGETPRDLTPADFELREDGVVQRIIGVSYADSGAETETPARGVAATEKRPRGQTVIFLQQSLSSTEGLRAAARALSAQAETLVRSADVEIVTDAPGIHVLAKATNSAADLRGVLDALAAKGFGREQLLRLNKAGPLIHGEEEHILSTMQQAVSAWMARYPRIDDRASRMLIFVSDGFDPGVAGLPGAPLRRNTARDQEMLARELAAAGWSVYCLAAGFHTLSETAVVESRRSRNGHPVVEHLLDPLRSLADESGGMVQIDERKAGKDLEAFSARVIITYQVSRPRDGKTRNISVRVLRPGLRVTTTRWSTLGSPASVTAARAINFAAGREEAGDLPITCTIAPGETLLVKVDLSPLDAVRREMRSGTLRAAIAVLPNGNEPFTNVQEMKSLDLASHALQELTFPLNNRDGAPAAVAVEEISTGAWGAARCTVQR